MKRLISILFLNFISWNLIEGSNVAVQREMTILLRPGESTCFYESAKLNQLIDVEYQVVDGFGGDLDVTFELKNPNGYPLESDYKKSDNIHRLTAHVQGDYAFCFDNNFSVYHSKTVFFEVIIEWDENAKIERTDEFAEIKDKLLPDSQFDFKEEKVQTMHMEAVKTTENIHEHLNQVKHHLDIRRSLEARDRNLAEANNFRVGAWSSFQIILMCIVGSVQVYMLRSLFETDPRANIWNKFKFLRKF